jgi:TPR repeat protein
MAFVWYKKAADNGSAKAQYYLGVCYRNGLGVPRDLVSAQHWFETAARSGSEEAVAALTKLRV